MVYNMTGFENATNLYSIVTASNALSNNLLFIVLMAVIGIFVYSQGSKQGVDTGLVMSGLSMTIIGALLWFAELLTWQILIVPIIIMFTGIIIKAFS